MKMLNRDYLYLKEKVTNYFKNTPADTIEKYRKEIAKDPRVKDINKRMRWDLYWGCGINRDSSFRDSIKGLHDSHIDTALRSIQRELGFYIK